MAKMNERKYGPKAHAKDRDKSAPRYVARKAKFGSPLGKPASPRAPYTKTASSYTAKPSGYSPRGSSTPSARPSYVKKPFVRSSEEGKPRTASFTPSTALGAKRPYVKSGAPARPAFGAPRATGYVAKRTYTPRLPDAPRAGGSFVAKRPHVRSGADKKPFTKSPLRGGVRASSYEPKKPVFKSVVPNKPRTASASWGEVATWYDKHLNEADTYHEKVILPNLMRVMDAKKGDNIIELACGQGYFSRVLHAKGASVTGVDIAPELIAIARAESPLIPYLVGSAEQIPDVSDATFNKALISLSIQNIEHTENVLTEAFRVLASGGELHIVMNHPAFRIPKSSNWDYDDKKKVQFRRVDKYLSNTKSDIEMHPGIKDSPKTISYHRPLQFYFKALAKTGFAVTKLEEWISHKDSDSGPRAIAENNARKEIPLFLYLKAVKQ